MAARLNNRHQQMVREKIQVSQLLNRLEKHVDGEIAMKPTQVDAAKFLINQAIGAAATTTVVAGDPENPLEHNHEVNLVINGVRPKDRPSTEGA